MFGVWDPLEFLSVRGCRECKRMWLFKFRPSVLFLFVHQLLCPDSSVVETTGCFSLLHVESGGDLIAALKLGSAHESFDPVELAVDVDGSNTFAAISVAAILLSSNGVPKDITIASEAQYSSAPLIVAGVIKRRDFLLLQF